MAAVTPSSTTPPPTTTTTQDTNTAEAFFADDQIFFAEEFDNASSDLTKIVHACLFSVDNPRFLIALERYSWMYFLASRLSSEGTRIGAPWSDFVLSAGTKSHRQSTFCQPLNKSSCFLNKFCLPQKFTNL